MPAEITQRSEQFDHLVDQVRPRLQRRYRMSFDDSSIDDIVSEVLLAISSRPRFCEEVANLSIEEGTPLFWSFVWSCARVWARNFARRNASRNELSVDEPEVFDGFSDTALELSTVVAPNQDSFKSLPPRLKRIRRVLSKHLSASDQELLSMRYMNEMTTKDIAQKLGISCGAARTRLSRALSRSQSVLLEHCPKEFK